MSRPKNFYDSSPTPKTAQYGPKMSKNDPKIRSNSDVRIEGIIENESCLTTWVDSKTVFQPYPDPKNSPLGPQKVKNDPKIRSKSKVKIEENKENKICWAPKSQK